MFDLTGKAAVVTGGGRGIGAGIVHALATAGASVVVTGRTAQDLERSAAQARRLGVEALVVPADITATGEIGRIVDEAQAAFGRIDVWVNNAGSARAQDVGPLLELSEPQWDAVVDLNLKWTFFACQAAAKAMADDGGSIINISSRSGSQPNPLTGQYGAAKAGLENLTATMAVEWGHLGIRVNAIAPGVIVTDEAIAAGGSLSSERTRQRQIESVPVRRLGTPDDIGPLCVYLASDEASYITGAVIPANGGSRIPVGYLSYLRRVGQTVDLTEGSGQEAERSRKAI